MKVKIFEGFNYLTKNQKARGVDFLENHVQKFLQEHPNIEIAHIKQSSSVGGDSESFDASTVISIWYKEGN